ncbi:MAG: hypothetical protein ABWZ79_06030 [Pedobacter agri]|uniref:Glycerophosphoryl diester phosphodiesterase membrane domain-containing protein n=1 Tax=Pedobacter agri TaxID=454586 RepID=A0A9X3DBU3_9SPHI|nr:hypothetical protein [Pedobacter agri]MCX3264739.1 hypothetical protein [Pedobacter agri]MDQ1140477.1 heme/copper-type cytochrome/quinol oxidase subunit 2 [Pedobacter agri]RZJ79769.1 MAG: hypothetical protein EOO47_09770 [Flavobacterium sp.]
MIGKIEFKKRRDFGQVINDTFTFMRQNFKALIKTYFTFCGLFVLASMSSMLVYQYKMVNIINTIGNGRTARGFGFGSIYGLEYFLSLLFSLATYASMTVAILSFISLYVQKGNQAPTTEEVWGYFKYYFFRVFGSAIVLILMLIVAFIFCLVPGFYLFPFVAMMFPIMVIENGTFGYSFSRSFKMIQENFWVTFGTLIVVWIIVYACMSMVVLPTTLFSMIGMFTSKTPHMSLPLSMATTVLQSLCQVFTIIPIITISLSYFNLLEQKENTGLMERITNFGSTEKPIDTRPEEY